MESGESSGSVGENVHKYLEATREARAGQMDIDRTESEPTLQRLDNVLNSLRSQMDDLKKQLDKHPSFSDQLQSITKPSPDSRERLAQLKTIKQAYDDLTNSAPEIPPPSSAIPFLLAAKALNQSLVDSKATLESAAAQLDTAQENAKFEESGLSDAKLLGDTMQARIARLENFREERSTRQPGETTRQLRKMKQTRKREFERELKTLSKALDEFAWDHLSSMFAAEELGGPVVGELSGVEDDMLTAGFSSQGRPKVAKGAGSVSSDKRQRRIDEIWGTAADNPSSEREAANQEFSKLITELYEAWRGRREAGVYVDLKRDSAAARFLVRAKVAQFHPKDARKIRLVDFGRELDS